ncbi:MAG: hypothetical protein QXT63_01070, partial [Thermoplasmata archaeon]
MNVRLGYKLIAVMLCMTLIPLAAVAQFAYFEAARSFGNISTTSHDALEKDALNNLQSILERKKETIVSYLSEREKDANALTDIESMQINASYNIMLSSYTTKKSVLENYFIERKVDCVTMSTGGAITNYFAAENGDVNTIKYATRAWLGYIALQIHDALELLYLNGTDADNAERIIAGTNGSGINPNGTMYEVFSIGYIGRAGYAFVLDINLDEVIHVTIPDGENNHTCILQNIQHVQSHVLSVISAVVRRMPFFKVPIL